MDSADALADFHQLQPPDLTYAYMTSNPFAIWAQAEFPYYSDMQDSSSTSTDVTSLSDFSGFPYVHQHTFDQIPVVMVPPASVGDFIDTSSFALGTTSDTFSASSAEQQEDIVEVEGGFSELVAFFVTAFPLTRLSPIICCFATPSHRLEWHSTGHFPSRKPLSIR